MFPYEKCPVCQTPLRFAGGYKEAVEHIIDCVRLSHPEVAEGEDIPCIDVGCEHLKPIVDNDPGDEDEPEAPDDHHSTK